MPQRAADWRRRIIWGEGRTAPLDWGKELWKCDFECIKERGYEVNGSH